MGTISNVRKRVQDILIEYAATLPEPYASKAKVHRYIPRILNNAELPAFLILPADGTTTRTSADMEQTGRLYLVRMYVAPLEQGIATELEEYAEGWLDECRTFVNKRLRLEDNNNTPLDRVYSAIIETDGGMVAAQYPLNVPTAPDYLMMEWRLRVVTRERLDS